MIIKANKQIGFIYKNNESIDKILKDGDVVFEKGFLREKTSTTLPITFGGVGKDLKDYKIYGNTKQQILPNGYTQVDYIQGSGTQYIDTNYIIKGVPTIETEINITENSNQDIFGMDNRNDNVLILNYDTTFYCRFGTYTSSSISDIELNKWIKLSYSKNVYINDVLKLTFSDYTFSTNDVSFKIGKARATIYSKVRYKYLKLYDNNVLVRDFIPCYRNSDNEVGLYDLVNNVFYTNQGTGVFTYGSVAPTPDAPIEIVSCGDRTKNIIPQKKTLWESGHYGTNGNKTNYDSRMRLIDLFPVQPNTEYYVYGKTFIIREYDNSQNFINNIGIVYSKNTFITNQNTMFLGIAVDTVYDNYDETTSKIMICTNDNVDKSYEPYGYKIPVNVRSENLFDIEYELEKQYLIDGTESSRHYSLIDNAIVCSLSNNTYGAKFFNKLVLNAGTYTFNCDISQTNNSTQNVRQRIRNFDNLTDIVSSTSINVSSGKYSVSFTIEETTTIGIMLKPNQDSDGTISMTNVQLVKGSTVPSKYIPYYNETTNIYLDEPLRKIDGYSDYIDFINGKLYRKITEHVFAGTDDDSYTLNSDNTNTLAVNINPNKKAQPAIKITGNSKIYSDKLNYINNITDAEHIYLTNAVAIDVGYKSAIIIYVDKSRLDGYSSTMTSNEKIALVKTWLQTNNLKVDYITYTPTEETITLPNIPTIDGNNTLNIETEITPSQVYIKYKSNE